MDEITVIILFQQRFRSNQRINPRGQNFASNKISIQKAAEDVFDNKKGENKFHAIKFIIRYKL